MRPNVAIKSGVSKLIGNSNIAGLIDMMRGFSGEKPSGAPNFGSHSSNSPRHFAAKFMTRKTLNSVPKFLGVISAIVAMEEISARSSRWGTT